MALETGPATNSQNVTSFAPVPTRSPGLNRQKALLSSCPEHKGLIVVKAAIEIVALAALDRAPMQRYRSARCRSGALHHPIVSTNWPPRKFPPQCAPYSRP